MTAFALLTAGAGALVAAVSALAPGEAGEWSGFLPNAQKNNNRKA